MLGVDWLADILPHLLLLSLNTPLSVCVIMNEAMLLVAS